MSKVKGRFTFRTTAVLFIVSAALEAASLTSEVPLFGAVRGGAAAIAYHSLYAGLFCAAAFGLWRAHPIGYAAVMAGAALYTLDRLLLLLDRTTLEAYIDSQLAAYGDVARMLDPGKVIDLLTLATALFIAGWWGFALYTHLRRAYFSQASAPPAAPAPDA